MDERDPEAGKAPAAPGWIVTVRHGKPRADRQARVGWREYIDWWARYDAADLEEGQAPSEALLAAAREAHVIYASILPRAVATALAVAEGRDIKPDPVFIEAALPPPRLPWRSRPRTWGVYSRISWWLGFSFGMESRQEAELRAEAAAATLAARALRGENVLLCGHGWFNRMMRPVLLSWGWRCVEDGGDNYWSFRRYVRKS